MKKSEYYKDILFYIEERLGLISAMEAAREEKEPRKRDLYLYMVEQRQSAIDKWLNEEVKIEEVSNKNVYNEEVSNKNVRKKAIAEKVKQDITIISKIFAEKVHELRKYYKLSMADLYEISGVSSSTINDIEKAKYPVGIEIILKLGYALKLSQDEIFEILKGNDIKIKLERTV